MIPKAAFAAPPQPRPPSMTPACPRRGGHCYDGSEGLPPATRGSSYSRLSDGPLLPSDEHGSL